MARPPKVALLIETSSSYGRGLLRGIARYARLHGPWSFFLEPGGQEEQPPPLREWGVDGVITLFRTRRQARRLLAARLPVVDLDFTIPGLVPWGVSNDEVGVAKIAAEHLLSRGLRHFAFVGWAAVQDGISLWESQRQRAFADTIAAAGFPCALYEWPRRAAERAWGREQKRLARWLRQQPRPLGVMASNDQRARHVLEAARLAGVGIPDDLAVIGVDNDETLCELSTPSISSVSLDTETIGYEGAALLHSLLKGRRAPRRPLLVPPLGVVARRSSDLLAMADPAVVTAVRFMDANLGRPIRISDVLDAVRMSRKTLELRFRRSLARTPHEELQRRRIDKVKSLLRQTDWPLKQIARATGFTYVEHLHLIFRKATGMTPSTFRGQGRGTP
ncbi:MAG TPA: XylR family transcriptional regulator [Planctomycetota bacterium]|jgi:LacI family transcriptional regulator|nr:XylR family transcriptional regulator [Planctomycetota bacterium]